jgi:hypothetical protein
MPPILNEVQAMQNPALGAVLLWRFVCGYSPDSSPVGTPLVLAFIVLPLALHARSSGEIAGTQAMSGLRKFEEKFRDRSDVLLSIHPRMIAQRDLSLRSLRIGLRAGLLTLVPSEAILWPRTRAAGPTESKATGELLKSAEKFGTWCRNLSLFEVSGLLKVEF